MIGPPLRPRELHVPESLASMDFNDFEPGLVSPETEQKGIARLRYLVESLFRVDWYELAKGMFLGKSSSFRILCALDGKGTVSSEGNPDIGLEPGEFCLVPAGIDVRVQCTTPVNLLLVSACS